MGHIQVSLSNLDCQTAAAVNAIALPAKDAPLFTHLMILTTSVLKNCSSSMSEY